MAAHNTRIIVHPYNVSLWVLYQHAAARRQLSPLDVEWIVQPDGRCAADLLLDGEADFAGTGSVPPLVGQSQGAEISYAAASLPRPAQTALLTAPPRSLDSLHDLVGRRIGMVEGSFHSEILARSAQESGLKYYDFTIVDAPEDESRAELRAGNIDAWLASDPVLATVERDFTQVPLNISSTPNRSFYFSTAVWRRENPQAARQLLAALQAADEWIQEHTQEAAELLASTNSRSSRAEDWQVSLQRRPWGLEPVSAAVLAEQQQAADIFAEQGFLERPIDVTQWTELSAG